LVNFRARLVNVKTAEAIPFAHIFFPLKQMIVTSDEFGYFEYPIQKQDSLYISSIGFEELKLSIEYMLLDSSINMIYLTPKVYMLDEIIITQYPTYEAFVKAIINPVFTEDEKKIIRAQKRMDAVDLSRKSGSGGVGGPITAIYNLFSKEAKYARKYQNLKEEDTNKALFNKKVNAAVIENLTGLTDSLTIMQFIRYCNFSNNFLDNSSEYELYSFIMQKYKAFIKKD